MDKIYIENLCSMFPNIDRDVIQLLYTQNNQNIVDSLLEISDTSKSKKNDDNTQEYTEDNTEDNTEDTIEENLEEENERKEYQTQSSSLLNFLNFNKKSGYEYQQL